MNKESPLTSDEAAYIDRMLEEDVFLLAILG